MQAPQGVDTKIVADNSETGAQQESGDDEPSLFVVYREASAVEPFLAKALILSASYPRSASSIDPDLRRDKKLKASRLS